MYSHIIRGSRFCFAAERSEVPIYRDFYSHGIRIQKELWLRRPVPKLVRLVGAVRRTIDNLRRRRIPRLVSLELEVESRCCRIRITFAELLLPFPFAAERSEVPIHRDCRIRMPFAFKNNRARAPHCRATVILTFG